MKSLTSLDFPDIEPLLIWQGGRSLDKMIWVHPYIDTWFSMGDDGCDQDMHIVTFDCGEDTFSVGIKSNWIDDRYNKYFDESEQVSKYDVYTEEYVDINTIFQYLTVLLEEDVYVALPRHGEPIKSIKELCAYREKYSTGQFCFSEQGEWVSEALRNCTGAWLNSDCGFHYDAESDTWGYDT